MVLYRKIWKTWSTVDKSKLYFDEKFSRHFVEKSTIFSVSFADDVMEELDEKEIRYGGVQGEEDVR